LVFWLKAKGEKIILCPLLCAYKIFMKKLGFIRIIRILIFIIISQ